MRSSRWVTVEATSLKTILEKLGLHGDLAPTAIAEGRVFVNRRRASSIDSHVPAETEVTLHAQRPTVELPSPFVLYQERGWIVVNKPAGIPTIADLQGTQGTLADEVARATGVSLNALHPTSRLDRGVSGVVIFATHAGARDELRHARERGHYTRRYVAIAQGTLAQREASWTWSIARDRNPMLRRAVSAPTDDARNPDIHPARSRARVIHEWTGSSGGFSILALAPETGRTHQLRVHASRAGVPLLGDESYGGLRRWTSSTGAAYSATRIALHCARVALDRLPTPPASMHFEAPIPVELLTMAMQLGLAESLARQLLQEAAVCSLELG